MKYLDKYVNVLLTVIFCAAVYTFWVVRYPYALVYQEEVQMFLFDSEYLMERIVYPAGVARYIAEFLVQFYNQIAVGAAVLTLVLLAIQQLIWHVGKRESKNPTLSYILSFLPVVFLWFAMGDESIKLTFHISLIFALISIALYPEEQASLFRYIYVGVLTPILYYLAGPAVLLFCVYVAIREWGNKLFASLTLLWGIGCIVISIPIVPQPAYRLFFGINYSLTIIDMPWMLYLSMLVCLLTMLFIHHTPKIYNKQVLTVVNTSAFAALMVVALFVVPLNYDRKKYDVFEYNYLLRAQRWDAIIAKAESTPAHSPLSAASYNLALGKLGQMNRAMQFRQNGWGGAFPPFSKNYLASLMTSEVYWQLGLVNTAQRFMFEAMEAIPDNNKSSRIIRRLAETNLVNGQYEVARKYLKLLQKTMFYSKWADKTLSLLDDEEAINSHPLYGELRQFRLTEDFVFSETEIDKIMGHLLMRNSNNNLAAQYLLLLPQLEGNKQKYDAYCGYLMSLKRGEIQQSQDSIVATAKDSIQ